MKKEDSFLGSEEGATAMEYALVAAGIAAVVFLAVQMTGTLVNDLLWRAIKGFGVSG